jgi:hypothetical protein
MRWTSADKPSSFSLEKVGEDSFERVVLLLPETVWAEEDNKSQLKEQRDLFWAREMFLCPLQKAVHHLASRSCEPPLVVC